MVSDPLRPAGRDADWDSLRLVLFVEVARTPFPPAVASRREPFLVALTDAFDRPTPHHAVYRQLRTFAVVRWPQIACVLAAAADESPGAKEDGGCSIGALFDEIECVLRRASEERERGEADALEREMALLRELLGDG